MGEEDSRDRLTGASLWDTISLREVLPARVRFPIFFRRVKRLEIP